MRKSPEGISLNFHSDRAGPRPATRFPGTRNSARPRSFFSTSSPTALSTDEGTGQIKNVAPETDGLGFVIPIEVCTFAATLFKTWGQVGTDLDLMIGRVQSAKWLPRRDAAPPWRP